MIRRNRANRILTIIFFLTSLALIVYSILRALESNIDLYLTPTQVKSENYNIDDDFKLVWSKK